MSGCILKSLWHNGQPAEIIFAITVNRLQQSRKYLWLPYAQMPGTPLNDFLPIIPKIHCSVITQFTPQQQNVNNSQFYNNEKR